MPEGAKRYFLPWKQCTNPVIGISTIQQQGSARIGFGTNQPPNGLRYLLKSGDSVGIQETIPQLFFIPVPKRLLKEIHLRQTCAHDDHSLQPVSGQINAL